MARRSKAVGPRCLRVFTNALVVSWMSFYRSLWVQMGNCMAEMSIGLHLDWIGSGLWRILLILDWIRRLLSLFYSARRIRSSRFGKRAFFVCLSQCLTVVCVTIPQLVCHNTLIDGAGATRPALFESAVLMQLCCLMVAWGAG